MGSGHKLYFELLVVMKLLFPCQDIPVINLTSAVTKLTSAVVTSAPLRARVEIREE